VDSSFASCDARPRCANHIRSYAWCGFRCENCELLGVAVGDGDAEEGLGFFGGIDFIGLGSFGGVVIAPEPDHLFGEFGGAVGGIVGAFGEAEMEVVIF